MGKYRDVNKELLELVAQKKTGKEISNILNLDYSTVHAKLRKLNINLYNYHNELKFDNTVFDTIDNEEKAYWLGFLFADGYISKNSNSIELSLKGDDFEHLKKFNTFLKNKKEVIISNTYCNNKTFSRCRCVLTNKHLKETLVALGCVPQKSLILKFPNLEIFTDKSLIKHFIRGYVDGDGCLSFSTTGKLNIQIIGTKEFLQELQKHIPITNNILYKDKRRETSNTFLLGFKGQKAMILAEYLYKNATIYLQRKYNRFAVSCSNI